MWFEANTVDTIMSTGPFYFHYSVKRNHNDYGIQHAEQNCKLRNNFPGVLMLLC